MIIVFLRAAIRMATPLLFAAIGEAYNQRAGTLNIGLEGMLSVGAVIGFLGAYSTGNLWIGVLTGMIGGALMGLFFALLTITLRFNQVLCGIAMNILAGSGLSVIIFRKSFGISGVVFSAPTITGFQDIPIPLLSGIPYIGEVLFNQNALTYLMFCATIISTLVLSKTRFGLQVRAVGDNPAASEGAGISVIKTRYICTTFGGLMCGLGGAYLSLAEVGTFFEGMVGGRGWIALALVIFGQWKPILILGGGLLFGGVDALQIRLQVLKVPIPYDFLLMLPYVLTIIVLAIGSLRMRGREDKPDKLGVAYKKE